MADDSTPRIETPEDYTLRSWLDAEADYLTGGVELTDVPIPEPHPNEIATREAVDAGVYTAADVGLPPE